MRQEASESTKNIYPEELEFSYLDGQVPENILIDQDPEEDPEEEPLDDQDMILVSGPVSETLFPIEPLRVQPHLTYGDSVETPEELDVEEGEEVNQPYTPMMAMRIAEIDAAKFKNIKDINGVIGGYVKHMTNKDSTTFYLQAIMEYIRAVQLKRKSTGNPISKHYWIWAVAKGTSSMNKTRRLRNMRSKMLDYIDTHIK